TAASGRPTSTSLGSPTSPEFTSTWTGWASMPCNPADKTVASMGRASGGRGGLEAEEVGLDRLDVGVGGGRGVGEPAVNALVILIEHGKDEFAPKVGGAREQILSRGEEAFFGRDAVEGVGFLEFAVKVAEFFDVAGIGHLAEVVGGGDHAADEAFGVVAEAKGADLAGRAGAADGAEHAVDFVEGAAERGEHRGGEGAAAQDVREGVFGPGAGGVGAELQVAAVVEHDGGETEFERTDAERGLHALVVVAGGEVDEAPGRQQGVLKTVVFQVDGLVVGVTAFKQI